MEIQQLTIQMQTLQTYTLEQPITGELLQKTLLIQANGVRYGVSQPLIKFTIHLQQMAVPNKT